MDGVMLKLGSEWTKALVCPLRKMAFQMCVWFYVGVTFVDGWSWPTVGVKLCRKIDQAVPALIPYSNLSNDIPRRTDCGVRYCNVSVVGAIADIAVLFCVDAVAWSQLLDNPRFSFGSSELNVALWLSELLSHLSLECRLQFQKHWKAPKKNDTPSPKCDFGRIHLLLFYLTLNSMHSRP